jgi:hypothetical protein
MRFCDPGRRSMNRLPWAITFCPAGALAETGSLASPQDATDFSGKTGGLRGLRPPATVCQSFGLNTWLLRDRKANHSCPAKVPNSEG